MFLLLFGGQPVKLQPKDYSYHLSIIRSIISSGVLQGFEAIIEEAVLSLVYSSQEVRIEQVYTVDAKKGKKLSTSVLACSYWKSRRTHIIHLVLGIKE
jgi:hypothetical protein